MTRQNWLKAHKKPAVTHTFVVVGFVLLVLFVAEPLFDRLERISGEAQLKQVELPAETGGIQYWVDHVEVTTHVLDMRGWAFIENHDSHDSQVFLVFESDRRTYVFDTMVQERPDVTAHFEELGLELDYSGFMSLIPTRRIADGEYTIGIYIRKGDIDALIYTDRAITKHRGTVEITG